MCIIAAINPIEKNKERNPDEYPEMDFDFTDIGDGSGEHSFTFEDISQFENLNSISINVFAIENEKKSS